MTPSLLRLAGHFLLTDGERSRRCHDWERPDWFPVEERAPLLLAMAEDNYPDKTDPDYLDDITDAPKCEPPPDFAIIGYLGRLLLKAGGGS